MRKILYWTFGENKPNQSQLPPQLSAKAEAGAKSKWHGERL